MNIEHISKLSSYSLSCPVGLREFLYYYQTKHALVIHLLQAFLTLQYLVYCKSGKHHPSFAYDLAPSAKVLRTPSMLW